MAKKIESMEDLLLWDEIPNIGLPQPLNNCCFHLTELFFLGNNEKDYHRIETELTANIKKWYEENLPNCPIPFEMENFYLTFRPIDEYHNQIFLAPIPFLTNFINIEKEFVSILSLPELHCQPIEKYHSEEELKKIVKQVAMARRDALKNEKYQKSFLPTSGSRATVKEASFQKMRQCNWLSKNLDSVFDFFNRPLPPELFEPVGKDKMLALIVILSEHLLNLRKPLPEGINYSMIIEPTDNYLLLVDYLESITHRKYRLNFDVFVEVMDEEDHSTEKIFNFSIDDIRDFQTEFYKEYPDTYLRENRPTSYEEILKNRTQSTWKRIQNERLIEQIQLNWEFLPTKMVTEGSISSLRKPREYSSKKDEAVLQQLYRNLERKLQFFEKSNPKIILSGIHTFEGYQAYVYANGTVLLEKFYTSSKKGSTPARDSAIYVMNFSEFADLSKYSRSELIQEIEYYHNPNVHRVCHGKNWEKMVEKYINGAGYSDMDLEKIELITRQISMDNRKVKQQEF